MKKSKKYAFGKDIYLLGVDKEGTKYWLESPSWDCNWYWGFGYVETYTNNNSPEKSRDIDSHTHIGGYTDRKKMNYVEGNDLMETTFNSEERKELKLLFEKFYLLKEKAEKYRYTYKKGAEVYQEEEKQWKEINSVEIPIVFNRIIEILTPENETPKVYGITL